MGAAEATKVQARAKACACQKGCRGPRTRAPPRRRYWQPGRPRFPHELRPEQPAWLKARVLDGPSGTCQSAWPFRPAVQQIRNRQKPRPNLFARRSPRASLQRPSAPSRPLIANATIFPSRTQHFGKNHASTTISSASRPCSRLNPCCVRYQLALTGSGCRFVLSAIKRRRVFVNVGPLGENRDLRSAESTCVYVQTPSRFRISFGATVRN